MIKTIVAISMLLTSICSANPMSIDAAAEQLRADRVKTIVRKLDPRSGCAYSIRLTADVLDQRRSEEYRQPIYSSIMIEEIGVDARGNKVEGCDLRTL